MLSRLARRRHILSPSPNSALSAPQAAVSAAAAVSLRRCLFTPSSRLYNSSDVGTGAGTGAAQNAADLFDDLVQRPSPPSRRNKADAAAAQVDDAPPGAPDSKHTPRPTNPVSAAESSSSPSSSSSLEASLDPTRRRNPKYGPAINQPVFKLHLQASRNNTLVTFTSPTGNTLGWSSAGRCGFKGQNKASFEGAYQSIMEIFKVVRWRAELRENEKGGGNMSERYPEDGRLMAVEVILRGSGKGREAMSGALMSTEGAGVNERVVRIVDRTPIKIGGVRAQKARRL